MPSYYQVLNLNHNPLSPYFEYPHMNQDVKARYITYFPDEILNKEIFQLFKKVGLKIKWVILFYKKPGASGLIHSDVIRNGYRWERCVCAINWNLTKASSIMNWWKCTLSEIWPSEQEATIPGIDILNGIHYGTRSNIYFEPHQLQLLESVEIIHPTLVRTDIPHNVVMKDLKKERWCLSIRFEETFSSWEKALEILRPYFI
ncbi:hypothetical protein [Legionella steigerwaltii]|nr:hypothetical protein [Legionella steigerwaltii]